MRVKEITSLEEVAKACELIGEGIGKHQATYFGWLNRVVDNSSDEVEACSNIEYRVCVLERESLGINLMGKPYNGHFNSSGVASNNAFYDRFGLVISQLIMW
jgi:hypothetical protein